MLGNLVYFKKIDVCLELCLVFYSLIYGEND